MSTYYNYYVGYKHDGKIYPLGPYDCFGKLKCVIWRSGSFASDMHEDFISVSEDMVSDELRKSFEYTDYDGKKAVNLKYLPLNELPDKSYIKKGYFLIDEVKAYEAGEEYGSRDLFYDHLDPITYAAMAQNECVFGKPKPKKDIDGEEYEVHSASDYMFYAYPDYYSKEYEADVIRNCANSLSEFSKELPEGYELVAILEIS